MKISTCKVTTKTMGRVLNGADMDGGNHSAELDKLDELSSVLTNGYWERAEVCAPELNVGTVTDAQIDGGSDLNHIQKGKLESFN